VILTIYTFLHCFAHCNLTFCLYGALGAVLLVRAIIAMRSRHHTEAQEHGVAAIVNIIMAMLSR
jgi:hypothetical protein